MEYNKTAVWCAGARVGKEPPCCTVTDIACAEKLKILRETVASTARLLVL
jgi:hypothetical protein